LEEIMDENGEISAESAETIANSAALSLDKGSADDEAIDVSGPNQEDSVPDSFMNGQIRALNGEIADDEYAADAINYQLLLGKIDALLERLKLDA
jgi:ankyrin repeat/BTB/POZ domain-containing protein 1